MDIRTFRASTLQEALELVRETLGPDAAVLHTREVKRSRLGFFSSNLVEVDASIEMPTINRLPKQAASEQPSPTKADPQKSSVQATNPAANVATSKHSTNAEVEARASDQPSSSATAAATSETANSTEPSVKSSADPSQPAASATSTQQADTTLTNEPFEDRRNSSRKHSPAMVDVMTTLLDAGVEPTAAKSLMQAAVENLTSDELNDAMLLQGRIAQLVGKSLRVAEPIAVKQGEQVVVAMIGSTGVGKTTTLAKIAKNLQVDHGCEIGLLTMDIFRPGAVDQLLQYAESLDATLEVVSSANQFLPALQRLKHCDIVFIDTAGRSPNDQEQIKVLQEILDAAKPTSVQLVVSATSSTRHVRAAVQQFSPLSPTGLVITKLDEAVEFGSWLTALQQIEVPVSYIAHGQHVPHDIMPANRRRLASFLVGHAAQLQGVE